MNIKGRGVLGGKYLFALSLVSVVLLAILTSRDTKTVSNKPQFQSRSPKLGFKRSAAHSVPLPRTNRYDFCNKKGKVTTY